MKRAMKQVTCFLQRATIISKMLELHKECCHNEENCFKISRNGHYNTVTLGQHVITALSYDRVEVKSRNSRSGQENRQHVRVLTQVIGTVKLNFLKVIIHLVKHSAFHFRRTVYVLVGAPFLS